MKKLQKSLLSVFLCLVLLAAAVLCNGVMAEATQTEVPQTEEVQGEEALVFDWSGTEEAPVVLGEGARLIRLQVVDEEGKEAWFEIHTDAAVVGEALEALQLIAGEEGPYGMFIASVLGERVVWEECGHYWAFYIDGQYAMTGVDKTELVPDTLYSLKAE